MTCPPYRLTFSTLQIGAFLGITIYAGMPRSFAAKANAAAVGHNPLVCQIHWKRKHSIASTSKLKGSTLLEDFTLEEKSPSSDNVQR
jgi:hypothetical protein